MNHSPRFVANSSSVLRPGATVLLAFLLFAGQSLTVTTAQQKNSNSGKRQPVTTLHSSDSQEGSRVAISSDRSLNNYEAYRRGDRFYVKIPAADVPRAEAVRGRRIGCNRRVRRDGVDRPAVIRRRAGVAGEIGGRLDIKGVRSVGERAIPVGARARRERPHPGTEIRTIRVALLPQIWLSST